MLTRLSGKKARYGTNRNAEVWAIGMRARGEAYRVGNMRIPENC